VDTIPLGRRRKYQPDRKSGDLAPPVDSRVVAWRVAVQKELDPRLRRAWFLLGLGSFSFWLGNVTWTYLENVLQVQPFPSIADIFFLGSYPLLLWGLLTMPGAPLTRRARLTFWFNLLITVATASAP
jgi:hypothetical protein